MLRILLSELLEECTGTLIFEELKVTDLCARAGISKVTFFKYFESKEELLRYFHRIWCLKTTQWLAGTELKGVNGLLRFSERLIESMAYRPTLFFSYYSYLLKKPRVLAPFHIPSWEREMIIRDGYREVEIKSISQIIDNFVLEAVFSKELHSTDPSKLSQVIYTYLIGLTLRSGINNRVPDFIDVRQEIFEILDKYKPREESF